MGAHTIRIEQYNLIHRLQAYEFSIKWNITPVGSPFQPGTIRQIVSQTTQHAGFEENLISPRDVIFRIVK